MSSWSNVNKIYLMANKSYNKYITITTKKNEIHIKNNNANSINFTAQLINQREREWDEE